MLEAGFTHLPSVKHTASTQHHEVKHHKTRYTRTHCGGRSKAGEGRRAAREVKEGKTVGYPVRNEEDLQKHVGGGFGSQAIE